MIPLGLTATASVSSAEIHKKILGYGSYDPAVIGLTTTTLIISTEEMEDIMKIVESLEDSGVLIKGITQTVENETKEQKGEFFGMLLGTLLLGY